ncbi:hypothetical protein [Aurantimonas marina]|uniref:hypothetical protein n=1 Tax=Aurantimonas marina TaxID=2780508 RepID=UPI0019D2626C|nr:hypothetical protein [Aurantimonas marina]
MTGGFTPATPRSNTLIEHRENPKTGFHFSVRCSGKSNGIRLDESPPGANLLAMKTVVLLAAAGVVLASCGMNRAVTVLPNTLDDLAELSKGRSESDRAAPRDPG